MTTTTETPAETPPTDRKRRLLLGSATDITVILIVIVALFAILDFDAFLTSANLINVLINASLLIVMAVGATFVLITGGVDLSVGSVLVFSGVIAGKVMIAIGPQGWGASIVGIVVSMLAGAVWGVVNGLVITKMRVPPLITTLGSFGAALGLAQIITDGNDLKDVPNELIDTLGVGRFLGLPWLVWVALLVALIGGVFLAFTRYGRRTYAIGSNAEAARRAGINVDRHLISVYAIAGLLAGLAGIMSYAQFGSTTLSGHGTDNLAVIAAVVIGGTSLFGGVGTMFGTLVGTTIPAVLANGLVIVGLNSFWRDFAVGVVLVAAVYLDQLRRRSRTTR
ncbi:ABC transporter permease [Micromonospora sp. WMMD1128]|uniref:ABC transporter permease n=1 Tax=unclassified Micromonospora TaxID=2617518 RepID=UPI00248C52C4|nr:MULTISPECIES: ABC transporter permease [unclassified Micromonospora]WBB75776.1 ABC transporter permease [Micromonospora sp. WMMD1128]WFE36434.1 ABC transporter permease [Micromonospora sp. WMMD975]